MNIKEYLQDHILLMDGAMGTYFNQMYPEQIEAEEANLLHPEWIQSIHLQYIKAGAQLIRTNTFAVNHTLFPDCEQRKEQIVSAVKIARNAVAESEMDCQIAASIGPIRQDIEMTDEDVKKEYQEIVDVFLQEQIHIFVLETFAELKWVKQLAKYIREKCEDAWIMAGFSVNLTGYTKYGYSMQQIVSELEETDIFDVFGFNCGIGVSHMHKMFSNVVFQKERLVSVLPNAGYQHELRGQLRYSDNPQYYAKFMEQVVYDGANVIGGCCGTTPEHIRALASMLALTSQNTKLPVAKKVVALGVQKQENKEPNAFMDKLQKGEEKVFVVELDSPFTADCSRFLLGGYELQKHGVDMVTVSDSPMARARADALLMAMLLQEKTGLQVMPHIACRDKNLIGLRSAMIGAHANQMRNFLFVTGDPVAREDRNIITGVFDVNSIRLMEYVKNLNEEVFSGKPVYYGGALNYAGVNVDAIEQRMHKKMEQGCSYFLTQPVFSDADVKRLRYLKEKTNATIICGIMPLVSYKNALYMHNEMPGIDVPDEVLAKYRPDMTREQAEQVAIQVSVEIAKKIYDFTDGFYLMTPFQRVHLVNQIIDEIRNI